MESLNRETQIIFALNKFRSNKKLNIKKIAPIFNIPKSILYNRINGAIFLFNRQPNIKKLTENEKKIII